MLSVLGRITTPFEFQENQLSRLESQDQGTYFQI